MQEFLRLALLALFLITVSAESICLSTSDASGIGEGAQISVITFPAGNPCDQSAASTISQRINDGLCAVMACETQFQLDSVNARFVNKGPEVNSYGCGAALIVNGKQYNGRVISNNEKDPCGGTCNDSLGTRVVLGIKIYENFKVDTPHADNTGNGGQGFEVGQLPQTPQDSTENLSQNTGSDPAQGTS